MSASASGHSGEGKAFTSLVADKGDIGDAPSRSLVEELALANHILFREGVVDAFGHVSVRHDKRPDRFLLARNMAPALVTADDIVEFDFDGVPVNSNGRTVYLERFIHAELFRARPDVMAVVHSHSPAVVPFSVVKSSPLRPICHMSGFLGEEVPMFEIRDYAGDSSDLLITNSKLGVALAKTMGGCNCALMRGHGSTVVGPNLRETIYRAVYTEVNARLQSEAMRLGEPTFLTAGEARNSAANISSQINRAWDFWRMRAEGKL
jgi:ribulose-5-phosphate 4-epimerase/fuculose-1-phosphate aldolase